MLLSLFCCLLFVLLLMLRKSKSWKVCLRYVKSRLRTLPIFVFLRKLLQSSDFIRTCRKKRLRKKDLSPSEKALLYRCFGRYYSVRKSIRLALEDLYRLRLESRSTIIGMYQTWVLLSSHPRPSKEEKSFLNYTINYLNGKSAAKKTG